MVVLSIIVPVFNVDKYLNECIQGVLNQTFQHWELLLVDDGSYDDSPKICDIYAKQDPRIHVVHKENEGVSTARNVGLKKAIGKYIIFLDSDDYWYDNRALEKLISIAEEHELDLVRGEYKAINECGNDLFSYPVSNRRKKYTNKLIDSSDFIKYAINGEFFLFVTLMKYSVIKNIRFTPNRIFLEDMLFYSQLCLKELRCMYIPSIRFYAYRKNLLSVSFQANPQKLSDSFGMCYEFHKLSSMTDNQSLKKLYQKNSLTMYYYTLETLASDEYYTNKETYIEDFKLKHLRKKICKWMIEYHLRLYSIIYYLQPICAIKFFRMRQNLSKLKNEIL